MAAPRIALYSAITGHYERPSEILPAAIVDGLSANVDLFRFTDSVNSGAASRWQEVRVTPRIPMDPIRSARAIKILGHPLLSDYDVTVWVDNLIRLKISPEALVERFLPSDADMAVPLHSYHDSVAVEFAKIADGWIDDPRRVREQRSAYRQEVPGLLAHKVSWTAILIRRNNPAVHAFNAMWWEHVLRYSRRDQLSFPYVCEMTPSVTVAHFAVDNYGSEFHDWRHPLDVDRASRARLWNPDSLSRRDLMGESRDVGRMVRAGLKKSVVGVMAKRRRDFGQ